MRAERPERPPVSPSDPQIVPLLESADHRVSLLRGLSAVAATDWQRLLDLDDAPLLSWSYLQGLEQTGCVGGETTWQPAHLVVHKLPEGELLAGAPAYLKYNSDGEWVDDFEWAAFSMSKGISYYPKLIVAVPFNPVGGGRLLSRPDLPPETRDLLRRLLLAAAKRICQVGGLSSANVLFPRPEPEVLSTLEEEGFLPRQQEQYHFQNRGPDGPYKDFEDFLQSLRSHRRTSIRRERRALHEAGITVRTHRGLRDGANSETAESPHFSRELLDQMFDLYVETSMRYTGELPYLNRQFFHLCADRLGDRIELVIARDRDGAVIAGAWNLRGDRRLFGRYWGQRDGQRIPFLHFEVCYYHAVERCIKEGLAVFEPGHGGEHKLVRGFSPVFTHSAHFLRDARLRRPIASVLQHEKRAVIASVQAAKLRSSLKALGLHLGDPDDEKTDDANADKPAANSGPSSRTD